MDTEQINRLITDEVDKIDDTNIKKFVKDVLAHERKYIDRDNYEYKRQFKNHLRNHLDSEDND